MRILIVEVNWLGDVLFSTPAIRAVRKRFPESFISSLVVPRVKEVLAGNPNIDEIIVNDEEGIHKGIAGKIRLSRHLSSKNFDMAILFHRSFTRSAIVCWAKIPRVIGYTTFKRWFLLTKRIPMPRRDSLHRVDYYLNIVKDLGCNVKNRQYEFFPSEEDDKYIEGLFKKEGIETQDLTVCLNPGGNWEPKRWPRENFSKLADRLRLEYNAKVIFSGALKDQALISEITNQMAYKPIVMAGKTTLKQAACLFKKAHLVISCDSGPLHFAASVGANVIALFGPTSPLITGPIGPGTIKVIQKSNGCTIPCYDTTCSDNLCMREITVDDVLDAVKEIRGL